jgi:hypothetical protein
MGLGLSIFFLVDQHFFCWLNFIRTLTPQCVYHSFLIDVVLQHVS